MDQNLLTNNFEDIEISNETKSDSLEKETMQNEVKSICQNSTIDCHEEDEDETLFNVPVNTNITKNVMRKLVIASIIGLVFLLAEIVGGAISHSLAIISDAAHMFSDLSGFIVSITAVWYGQKPASKRLGFGFQRAEVIGALGSIMLIWVITVYLIYEATMRIIDKEPVTNPTVMLITAGFGLFCNLVMAKVLHSQPTITHQCSHDHGHGHNHGDHGHNHGHSHSHHGGHFHEHKHSEKKSTCNHSHSHKSKINEGNKQKQNMKVSMQEYNKQTDDIEVQNQEIDIQNELQLQEVSPLKQKRVKQQNLSQIEEKDNYNLRAAMIHVIGDIIQSVGVLIAALLIYFLGNDKKGNYVEWNYWHLSDPICTYIFSIIVLFTTFRVSKDCFMVLMEAIPEGFDVDMFKQQLQAINNVIKVHDLHIWSISIGKPSLSVHLSIENQNQNGTEVLFQATKLARQMGIYHTTIQIEDNSLQNKKGYIKCSQNIHN